MFKRILRQDTSDGSILSSSGILADCMCCKGWRASVRHRQSSSVRQRPRQRVSVAERHKAGGGRETRDKLIVVIIVVLCHRLNQEPS